MYVDYRALFRVKTSEGVAPPTSADVSAMITLALMRAEVWLTQELQERGDLEIELTSVDTNDWNSERLNARNPH